MISLDSIAALLCLVVIGIVTDLRMPSLGAHQVPIIEADAKVKCLCAGRRWRKSGTGIHCALVGHGPHRRFKGALAGGEIWWISNSYKVSSSIWRTFVSLLAGIAIEINKAERRIELPGGGAITVKSAAAGPDALVGSIIPLTGVVLDEAARHPPLVYSQAIAPALTDIPDSWSIHASTPKGFNHFHDLFQMAGHAESHARWQLPSTSNPHFDTSQLPHLRRTLSAAVYQQEIEAQFLLISSARAFMEFSREKHVREVEFDPRAPVTLVFSFKGDPPAMLVIQDDAEGERVLDEITVAAVPSVPNLVAEFRRRYPNYSQGHRVTVTGDASTAGPAGKSTSHSDWEQLRQLLPRALHRQVWFNDAKDSANVVNAVLRGPGGGRPFVAIHPRCERLISDLETTENRPGTFAVDHEAGRGHHAFAWAARLHRKYPRGPRWTETETKETA